MEKLELTEQTTGLNWELNHPAGQFQGTIRIKNLLPPIQFCGNRTKKNTQPRAGRKVSTMSNNKTKIEESRGTQT